MYRSLQSPPGLYKPSTSRIKSNDQGATDGKSCGGGSEYIYIVYIAAATPREMYPSSRMLNSGLDLEGCAPALLGWEGAQRTGGFSECYTESDLVSVNSSGDFVWSVR